MNLIIVESPTKARTLSRFLGKDYQIEASMGHVRDLPESRLGIDVDHDFTPEYVVSAKKKDRVKELQDAAKKADTVILATDPDREGEAIAWHIASLLDSKNEKGKSKKSAKNFARITFHEITESAIKEALAHPGTLNMQLVDAQQARRLLDRLVGYKLSPLLWRKIRRGLSAGRVQSVAVRLVVEREREIEKFVAQEYWEIVASLVAHSSQFTENHSAVNSELRSTVNAFEAKLTKIGEVVAVVNNKEEADKIVADLEKATYHVSTVQTREAKRNPYAPFTTSTLQQAAANVYGWSAKRTMQVAQNLYEQGLITYHRTDSTNLAIEAVTKVREYIAKEFGANYVPNSPRLFKTKSKVAQEAHEAIRPTNVEHRVPTGDRVDHEQTRLYELIWKRFVACQMTEARSEQTAIDILASVIASDSEAISSDKIAASSASQRTPRNDTGYTLRASGSRVLFDGWQILFNKANKASKDNKANEENKNESEAEDTEQEKDQALPALTVNETLNLLKLDPSQHFTQPPPRYNEASLIKILEEYGIGRPSTYAPIISTIQERQYVEKLDKRLYPTALGFAVNDFLMAHFPNIFDYQFTAKMEDELDEIANGEKQWIPVIHEFYDPFAVQLGSVTETAGRVKVEVEETDEKCPNDGAPLVVRVGKFGKFLACSNFPECKFTKQFSRKVDVKCPTCGIGDVVLKRTRTKKTFYGCSRYPDCNYASWTKPKNEVPTATV